MRAIIWRTADYSVPGRATIYTVLQLYIAARTTGAAPRNVMTRTYLPVLASIGGGNRDGWGSGYCKV